MAIQTKDDAQSKADKRVDRSLTDRRPKKFVPLMERKFDDLVSLAEQLEWIKQKQRIKDKNQTW
jgi:hypothetical protein